MTDTQSSYLAVPPASSYQVAVQPPVSTELLTTQSELLGAKMKEISVNNPSVTLTLNEPLAPELNQELVNLGYSVFTSSEYYRTTGADPVSRNRVTVSLPGYEPESTGLTGLTGLTGGRLSGFGRSLFPPFPRFRLPWFGTRWLSDY